MHSPKLKKQQQGDGGIGTLTGFISSSFFGDYVSKWQSPLSEAVGSNAHECSQVKPLVGGAAKGQAARSRARVPGEGSRASTTPAPSTAAATPGQTPQPAEFKTLSTKKRGEKLRSYCPGRNGWK